MSDKPISVGDLVMVARGHSCDLGRVFTVVGFANWGGMYCTKCGDIKRGDYEMAISSLSSPYGGAYVKWLIRIDPPALPESGRATNGEKEKV